MKATITEQAHRVTLKITEARVSLLRQISPSEVELSIEFIATHYCKTQIIEGIPTETAIPFQEPIVYDRLTKTVPFDLWIGIVKSADTPEILPAINAALVPFGELFANSMAGFELSIQSVTMG